jgi:hypothetical protein
MLPYVERITDVAGNRHCGFRSIVVALGRHSDMWHQIRNEMFEELCNKELYEPIFGRAKIDEMMDTLAVHSCGSVDRHKNIDFPEMTLIAANRNRKGVIVLNKYLEGLTTSFPLRGALPAIDPSFIVVANVMNYTHFVQV